MRKGILALFLISASAALAQTAVKLNFVGSGSGNAKRLDLSGAGTIDPFGPANVYIAGNIGDVIFAIYIHDNVTCADGQFSTTDEVDASGAGTSGIGTISGTATVSGGACGFATATGSFSFTITAPPIETPGATFMFGLTGSGTITPGVAPKPTSEFPFFDINDTGYPVSGPGGGSAAFVGCSIPAVSAVQGAACGGVTGGPLSIYGVSSGAKQDGENAIVYWIGDDGTYQSFWETDQMMIMGAPQNTTSHDRSCPNCEGQEAGDVGDNSGVSMIVITPQQLVSGSYTATPQCANAASACWISIPNPTGNIQALSRAAITAFINPQGLGPGTYTGSVAIAITTSSGAPSTVNVPVTLVLTPPEPILTISQTGLQFVGVSGTGTQGQSIAISNAGAGPMPFSASVSTSSGGNWLTISNSPGSASAGTPAVVKIQVDPSSLSPGSYSGRVDFIAKGAANSPQSVEVLFTVLSSSAAGPLVTPAELSFVAPASGNPASQGLQLFNLSSQTLTASTTLTFQQGAGGWLTTTSSQSTVTSAQPLDETVTVNVTGLAPGIYRASLDIHLAETNGDYLVPVSLLVPNISQQQGTAQPCTPTQLLPVFTNLEGGFQTPGGVPVPVQVSVTDDCGAPLTVGSVVAYFPGSGDPTALLVPIGNGQWTGSWRPRNLAGGTASVGVLAASLTPALYGSSGITGTLSANTSVPLIGVGGVVSAASLAANAPLAPGSYISIFGSNLASGSASATALPYPTQLGWTQVLLGGQPVPLQYAGSGQINAVVPYDVPINTPQQLIVEQNGVSSLPETVVISAAQPSVFTQDQSGKGAGVIDVVKANGSQFLNTPGAPAAAGDALVIYCTGLGAVTPEVSAGSAAPFSPPSATANSVTVTLGGQPAKVLFAGLAPGYAGLYQVNAIVPAGTSTGPNVSVVLSVAGAMSPPVTVAIQ